MLGTEIGNLETVIVGLNRNQESIVDNFSDISSETEELSAASQEIYGKVDGQNIEFENIGTAMEELQKVIDNLNEIIGQFRM